MPRVQVLCTSFELFHSAETWIELLSILGVPLLVSSVYVYNLQGCSGCKSIEGFWNGTNRCQSLEHDSQISGKDQPFDQGVSGSWFWFLVEKRPAISPEQGSKGSRGYYANGRNTNRNVRIESQNVSV